jgi:hypothetical protein
MAILAVTHNLAMAMAAELYVKRRRRQVRGMLAALSPAAREETLTLLARSGGGATRSIVTPLLTELGFREGAPADAPTGRGDEPSPTKES